MTAGILDRLSRFPHMLSHPPVISILMYCSPKLFPNTLGFLIPGTLLFSLVSHMLTWTLCVHSHIDSFTYTIWCCLIFLAIYMCGAPCGNQQLGYPPLTDSSNLRDLMAQVQADDLIEFSYSQLQRDTQA